MNKFVLALVALIGSASPALADDRVALVVSNSNYAAGAPLINPHRDAQLISEALKDAGFTKVIEAKDLKLAEFKTALSDFKREAASAQVALVYFAGHGVEVDRKNFLIPVDAAVKALTDVPNVMMSLDTIKGTVHEAKRLKVIVIDACRDDPFADVLKDAPGLRSGRAEAKHSDNNLVVVFAASEGQYAEDGGQGENSPFAQALASRLVTPGMEIDLLFRNVHDDVRLATQARQSPAVYATLSADPFYFIAPPPVAPAGMTPANEVRSPAEIELEFWKAVVELDEADLYQIYLDKVEKREFAGAFTELAKRKLPRAAGSAPIKIAAPAQRVAAKTAPTPPCVAGAKLDVFADGKWYPSTAKGKDAAGRCEIHYDGWDDKYDLAVGPDRMRAPEPQPVVSAEDKARLDLVKPLIAQAQAQASANNYLGAAESFEKAARAAAKIEAGHTIAADAAVLSAVDYLVAGGDSAKNLLRAGRMFKLAAELGDAGGARSYAYMLQIGYGVAKDEGRARRVLKPFAEIGDRLAMAQYGQMLMLGQGGPRELKEGREFIRKSAEGGNATGMLYHAHRLRREQGDAAAAAWYSRAAKKGNTEAMLAFGRLLLWSKEMPRDEAEGKKWLKKAADKNDPHAMFELAQILLRDAATQAEGASLAATASTFGNPEHRLFYAKLLEKGIGVPKDIARARVQYEVLLLPRSRTNRYYRKRAQLELADLRGM